MSLQTILHEDPPKDWNVTELTWRECLGNLLDTEKFCDINFTVERNGEKGIFKAHKIFLSMSSPVFEAMFFGSLPEKSNDIIITDINPNIFKILLQYIYTSVVEVNSYEVATDLYYVAEKYMFSDLKKICVDFITLRLHPEIALQAYEFATMHSENELKEKVLIYTGKHLKDILEQESFYGAQPDTIANIFDQDILNIEKEVDLFDAVVRYADFHNVDLAYNPYNEDLTGIMKILQTIRFLTMTNKEFIESMGRLRFFTDSDSFAILANKVSKTNISMPRGLSSNTSKRRKL